MKNCYVKLFPSLLLAVFLNPFASVMAADGAALYTQKACQTCHGQAGKSPILALYPKLNGQNKDYLVQQLKDIKNGQRNNGMSAAMKAMTANLTDDEIDAISEYLSQQ